MSTDLETTERLTRTLRAVAQQVPDDVPVLDHARNAMPGPARRGVKLALAAACVAVVVTGLVVWFVVARGSGDSNPGISGQPPVTTAPAATTTTTPTKTVSDLLHLLPGPSAAITELRLNDPSPDQPPSYQLAYAGQVDGADIQLLIGSTDTTTTSHPQTMAELGCDPNEPSGSPRSPGTLVLINNHQACLVTDILGAMQLNWLEPDGVTVGLQSSSALGADRLQAIGRTVTRDPAGGLQLDLSAAPPPGLELVGRGERPITAVTSTTFEQDACTYMLQVRAADPDPFGFNVYAPHITVRGQDGRRIGENNISWVEQGSLVILGASNPSADPALEHCDPAPVAETLTTLEDTDWNGLLVSLGDRVIHG